MGNNITHDAKTVTPTKRLSRTMNDFYETTCCFIGSRKRAFSSSNIYTRTGIPLLPSFFFRINLFIVIGVMITRFVFIILRKETYTVDIAMSAIQIFLELYRYFLCWDDLFIYRNKDIFEERFYVSIRTMHMYTNKTMKSMMEDLIFGKFIAYFDVIRLYIYRNIYDYTIDNYLVLLKDQDPFIIIMICSIYIRVAMFFITYYLNNMNQFTVLIDWTSPPVKLVPQYAEDVEMEEV